MLISLTVLQEYWEKKTEKALASFLFSSYQKILVTYLVRLILVILKRK